MEPADHAIHTNIHASLDIKFINLAWAPSVPIHTQLQTSQGGVFRIVYLTNVFPNLRNCCQMENVRTAQTIQEVEVVLAGNVELILVAATNIY